MLCAHGREGCEAADDQFCGSSPGDQEMSGTITKRGKNSWQIRFDAAPVNGKRSRRIITVRGSFAGAKKE
jgi:hypothetical protein